MQIKKGGPRITDFPIAVLSFHPTQCKSLFVSFHPTQGLHPTQIMKKIRKNINIDLEILKLWRVGLKHYVISITPLLLPTKTPKHGPLKIQDDDANAKIYCL